MMLDAMDRRAEQEGIAASTLRKYQIRTGQSKAILYNNIARAGEMPATIIKKGRALRHPCLKRITKQRKEIPVFSLED